MLKIARILAFAAMLLPGIAGAQSLSVMPAQTVAGRLGVAGTSGPWQAIPFSVLVTQLLGGPIQTANTVYAGPTSGGGAAPAFRALVGADLPAPGASSLGGVQSLSCSSHNWFSSLSTSGVFGCTQPSFADLTSSLACSQTPALTGDVTSSAGSCATTIAANAVTNAKMATMNAWTIKMNNTSSAATPTDTTIDGLTLKASPTTSDELPIWDVAGTAMKKATVSSIISAASQSPILLNTLTASGSASLSDTSSLTASYTQYELVFENLIPATTSNTLVLQVHSGGSYQTTGYVTNSSTLSGNAVITDSPTTGIYLNHTTAQPNSGPGVSGTIRVFNPSASALHSWVGQTSYGSSGGVAPVQVMGFWNTSAAIDGFEVTESAGGNITSGVIKIYGIP